MQLQKGLPKGTEVYLRAPGKGRKRFALVARWGRGTEKQKTQTLKLPEIDTVNRLFITRRLSYEDAHKTLSKLAAKLTDYRAAKRKEPKYSKANKKILDQYFAKVYGPRDVKHPKNAYRRLLRIINLLGASSLATTPDTEFYALIKGVSDNPRTRKRLMSCLSQLLKFIGRNDFQVLRTKNPRPRIKHLTLEEFKNVVAGIIDENFALLCWAMFATGCRPGEVFFLTKDAYNEKENVLFVDGSIDGETLKEDDTKTGESRHTVPITECLPYLRKWIEIPRKERLKFRKQRHGEMFNQAVHKVYKEKEKMVLYDLRHSYAIWWLNKGASTKLVAQSLGNSQIVCEMHYQGHYLNQGGVEFMNLLQNKG